MNSSITNCDIMIRHGETGPMFTAPDPRAEHSGDMYVTLDHYLICPLDMFSSDELEIARKRYHEGRPDLILAAAAEHAREQAELRAQECVAPNES